jgi:hypothetical protein
MGLGMAEDLSRVCLGNVWHGEDANGEGPSIAFSWDDANGGGRRR